MIGKQILILCLIVSVFSQTSNLNEKLIACSSVSLDKLNYKINLIEYSDIIILKLEFATDEDIPSCFEELKFFLFFFSVNEKVETLNENFISLRAKTSQYRILFLSEIPKEILNNCRNYSSEYLNVKECFVKIGFLAEENAYISYSNVNLFENKYALYNGIFFITCIDSYTKNSNGINTVNNLLLCYESYQSINYSIISKNDRSNYILKEYSSENEKKYRVYKQWLLSDFLPSDDILIFNKCIFSECKQLSPLLFNGLSKSELYFTFIPNLQNTMKNVKIKKASLIIKKVQKDYNILYYLTNKKNKILEELDDNTYKDKVNKIIENKIRSSSDKNSKEDIELVSEYSSLYFYQDITQNIKIQNDFFILSLNYIPQNFDIIFNLEYSDSTNNSKDLILNVNDIKFFEEYKIIDQQNPNLYFSFIIVGSILFISLVYFIFVLKRIFS